MRAALLDTRFGADLIAREMVLAGVEVVRIGRVHYNEQVPWCATVRNVDYSSQAQVLDIAREMNISLAVSGSTDLSFSATMSLNTALKNFMLGTNFRWEHAVDKRYLQKTLYDAEIPSPRFFQTRPGEEEYFQLHDGQLMIKPADAYSGRGVTKVDAGDPTALFNAVKAAEQVSPSGVAIVQEWIPGDLYSLSCLVEGYRVIDCNVVREFGLRSPWTVDASFVTSALDSLCPTLIDHAEKISHSIGLDRGLLHAQFISDGKAISFLEVFHRMPGDLYGALIELSVGPGYLSNYTRAFLGEGLSSPKSPGRPKAILRLTLPRANPVTSGGVNAVISKYDLEEINVNEHFAVRSTHRDDTAKRQVVFLKSNTPLELMPALFVELGEILRV